MGACITLQCLSNKNNLNNKRYWFYKQVQLVGATGSDTKLQRQTKRDQCKFARISPKGWFFEPDCYMWWENGSVMITPVEKEDGLSQCTSWGQTNFDLKKILPCIIWDNHAIVSKNYLKSGQTINSESYSKMLHKVGVDIWKNWSMKFWCKVVMFHQDNKGPDISVCVNWNLYKLQCNLIPHPPYSLDMALSNYYLFLHLKLHLSGAILNSPEEVKNEVEFSLHSGCSVFKEGIKKLSKHWQ